MDYVNEDTSNLGHVRPVSAAEQVRKSQDVADAAASCHSQDPDPTVNVAVSSETPTEHAAASGGNGHDLPSSQSGCAASSGELIAFVDDNRGALPTVVASHLVVSSRLSVGDVVAGRYVIVDNLPGSGMGQIYKALDRRRASTDVSTTYVALKFAKKDAGDESKCSKRIEDEFHKLSRLYHCNIVRVIDIGVHTGIKFIVLEWLEGQSLLKALEGQSSKRMALARARAIIRSVAAGLAHAHEQNIVHGDVKPSNIFITERDGIKIVDFGASFSVGDDGSAQSWATRAYASADILAGNPATKTDDVYSLGVTAYLLLSGNRPFGTDNADIAQCNGLKPESLPPDAEEDWPVVEAALSFNAMARPRDAGKFLADFEKRDEETKTGDHSSRIDYIHYAMAAGLLLLLGTMWTIRLDKLSSSDVQVILRQADVALLQGSLIEPEQASALDFYRAVLKKSPDNARALDGLDNVASRLLARAGKALAANDFPAARKHLSLAEQASPAHPGISPVAELVDRHAADLVLRAERIVDQDPEGAEVLLQDAEQLIGADDDRIASIRAEIAESQIDRELEPLIVGIDERILAERLAVPRGDSAIDLLARARGLRPDDKRLPLAANRIVSALLFQALFAVSEGKLDQAQAYIAAARSVDVPHLAMARAEYELAKARDRVAEQNYIADMEKVSVE